MLLKVGVTIRRMLVGEEFQNLQEIIITTQNSDSSDRREHGIGASQPAVLIISN